MKNERSKNEEGVNTNSG